MDFLMWVFDFLFGYIRWILYPIHPYSFSYNL